MSPAVHATVVSGAGNRFVVLDGLRGPLPADVSELARELARSSPPDDDRQRVDGVLVMGPATSAAADFRFSVHNADGSRPEMCGNGLRCAGMLARARSLVRGEAAQVETDAGVLRIRYEQGAVFVHLGRVTVAPARERIEDGSLELQSADVGNPHAVIHVDELANAPLQKIGESLQTHRAFPAGVNVELVRVAPDGTVDVRIFERGVGETLACGTGAAAVAAVCVAQGVAVWPVAVRSPGGTLTVDTDGSNGVWQTGPVHEEPLDDWMGPILREHGVATRAQT